MDSDVAAFLSLVSVALSIWALFAARGARARAREAQSELQRLQEILWRREQDLAARFESRLDALASKPSTSETRPAPAVEPAPLPHETLFSSPRPQDAAAHTTVSADSETATTTEPATTTHAPAPPPTEPAAPARPALPAPGVPTDSLEERIGIVWFTRIGAAVLVLGAAYFFKFAADNEWIGPAGRVGLGALAGAALLGAAERLSGTTARAYVQGLLGIGVALLSVSAYAAYGLYALVPPLAAFAALAGIAVLGGALAVRHRAQVVMGISLAAALANPVLMSTHQDAPAGLFGYLALVTTAALWASLRAGFDLVPWLAFLGTLFLGAGWYQSYFDASAGYAWEGGARAPGHYHALATRTVPVLAGIFFAAQSATYGVLRRDRPGAPVHGRAALLWGLVVGPIALSSLLFDTPILLGAVAVAGAAASWLTLSRAEDLGWIAGPMLAGFVVVVSGATQRDVSPEIRMLAGGAWLTSYLAVFGTRSRDASGRLAPPPASTVSLVGVALVLAMFFSALVLVRHHPDAFALCLFVLGSISAGLAAWTGHGWLAAGSFAAGAVLFAFTTSEHQPASHASLGAAAAWAVSYASAGGWWAARNRKARAGAALVMAAAIGFSAFVFWGVADSLPTLRALCIAIAAVGTLWIALRLRTAEDPDAAAVQGLSATALALSAVAAAVFFSGVTITVLWAALAALAVIAGARNQEGGWRFAGYALFVVVCLRGLSIDLRTVLDDADRFQATLGREGRLVPALLINPRAIAGLATSASALASAWVLRRRSLSGEGAVLAGVGYAILLCIAGTEVNDAMRSVPALPARPLDQAEFEAWLAPVLAAFADGRNARAVAVTLTLGLSGATLLGAGFVARSPLHRAFGLGVLVLTLAKLALWDLWNLPRIFQVMVLMGVGALLLGAGLLYARFGNRWRSLVEPEKRD